MLRLLVWMSAICWASASYAQKPRVDGFAFRSDVTVQVASSEFGLQVSIPFDSKAAIAAGQLQSDCRDIRVTSADGGLLPYWREGNCNLADNTLWVRADLIPPTTTLYVFTGNPDTGSQEDPHQVFLAFDNFETDPNTSGYWQNIYRSAGNPTKEFVWGGSTDQVLYLARIQTDVAGGGTFAVADASWMYAWGLKFRYRIGGGGGANGGGDGLAFGFFHQGNAGKGGELAVAQPGYAVEWDALTIGGDNEPFPHHIALESTSAVTPYPLSAIVASEAVKDNLWHTATIRFQNERVSVDLDGMTLLTGGPPPGSSVFDKNHSRLLFGAASGLGDQNDHAIDDLMLWRLPLQAIEVTAAESMAVDPSHSQVGCDCHSANSNLALYLAVIPAWALRRRNRRPAA